MRPRMVSVCVPAYNRPDMLRQLIHSFLRQDYPNKELVISDDSSTDRVSAVVSGFNNPSFVYVKNRANLGLTANSYNAMKLARGDYIIIMGDDDLFLSSDAISRYAAIFDSHPSVSYVNANKAQFSPALAIENIYTSFHHDAQFGRGTEAMMGVWTTSINMSGIGLRNAFPLDEIYPQENLLFPQLEYVGHIINQANSYGIAAVLIGLRAHPDQLGFVALRGEGVKDTERHGTVELFTIYSRLAKRYYLPASADFLAYDLIERRKTDMLKEKLIVGNDLVRLNYRQFCSVSAVAKHSTKLKAAYCISQVVPRGALRLIRAVYIFSVRRRNHHSFAALQGALAMMASWPDKASDCDLA